MNVSVKAIAGLAVFALVMGSSWAIAEVYKTVDKDGNVVYTDKPPSPDAEPEKLRELSVVPRPSYSKDTKDAAAAGDEVQDEMSVGDMRRMYRDFRLTRPTAEQTFWGTENVATVGWNTSSPLMPGMTVQILLNGQPMGAPTTQSVVATPQLDRGEYTATAQLLSPSSRVVISSDPVVFFVKQQFQRGPRISPSGGG